MSDTLDTFIHPTAVIDSNARLGQGVQIGPYCVVGANVTLGDRVQLVSHVAVDGYTTIGEDTKIYPFASIGHAPQDLKFKGEPSELIIGARNTIREHATMNPGTETGAMKTVIGNDGLFMIGTHIAHDCVVGNKVIMANNATLGGHVKVGNNVLIGGLAAVHQWIRIGDFAVIGGLSGVEHDVLPYALVKGERASLGGLNLVGLERNGFSKDDIRLIQKSIMQLFKGEGTLEDRIDALESAHGDHSMISDVIAFARGRERFPLCAPKKT